MWRASLKIAACLLLGAVTSVAVAWACASERQRHFSYFSMFRMEQGEYGFDEDLYPTVTRSCGVRVEQRQLRMRSLGGLPSFQMDGVGDKLSAGLLAKISSKIPGVSESPRIQWTCAVSAVIASPRLVVRAAGWPWHAVTGEHVVRGGGAEYLGLADSGLALQRASDQSAIILPIRPLWPGFAADTATYAAAWWLVLLAPVRARATIRRRRGQCLACGYSLAGNTSGVCPECGKPVKHDLTARMG